MNLDTIPPLTFYEVVGICCGVSGFLVLLFLAVHVLYFRSRKRAKKRKKKLKQKLAKLKEVPHGHGGYALG